jgi:hypothetical protein
MPGLRKFLFTEKHTSFNAFTQESGANSFQRIQTIKLNYFLTIIYYSFLTGKNRFEHIHDRL